MDWSNERYVRLYTRDSKTWLLLSWEGQAVLSMFLRKCDRCGIMSGAVDAVDLAVIFANGIPVEVVETGLARLLKHGVIESGKEGFFMPKFLEAQETSSSDAQRQRESREKRLAKTRVTSCDIVSQEDHDLSHGVTFSHALSRPVTSCHNLSQPVTPSVPSVPSVPTRTVLYSFAVTDGEPPIVPAGVKPEVYEALKTHYSGKLEQLKEPTVETLMANLSSDIYSLVDVPFEIARAAIWESTNGEKTPKGTPRFLIGWMDREQNKYRPMNPQPSKQPEAAKTQRLDDMFDFKDDDPRLRPRPVFVTTATDEVKNG